MTIAVASLHVHPVKGLRGIAVREALATGRGLAHDRRFMVVDAAGNFLSQRTVPRMATVWTDIGDGELRLAAPGIDEIALPLEPEGGEPLAVRVWDDICEAIAPSAAADRWLSEYLGTSCRLVYMPEATRRASSPRFAGDGKLVGFADGYAFLVASEASLADLNARLARPVTMERFRPNIVVRGTQAFAEDNWGEFSVGDAVLRAVKPCGRCRVTTVDPSTGEVTGPEPLATLAGYRDSREYGPLFGMNCVTLGTGLIRVGDAVQANN